MCRFIPALLSSKRLEGDALKARYFGLEEAKVHERRAAVVLTFDVVDAVDLKHRDAAAVRASDDDVAQLAAAQKPEGSEEQVIGLKHVRLPLRGEPDSAKVRSIEVSPSLL
jgi:hypothetical protein